MARGTAWAEGLLATANAADPTPAMPTPVITSVGFVQSRDNRAKLAVIHYFRPRQLFKALRTMPKSVPFAGESFLVVARPGSQYRTAAPRRQHRSRTRAGATGTAGSPSVRRASATA